MLDVGAGTGFGMLKEGLHAYLLQGVFAEGYALHQVLRREQMSRGTFFADTDNKKLFVWLSNNFKLDGKPDWAPRIEASTRGEVWRVNGAYVSTRGLRFRYPRCASAGAKRRFRQRKR